jgi:hypothetical protein
LQKIEYVEERAWYASTTELEDVSGVVCRIGRVVGCREVAEHDSPVVCEFGVEEIGEIER